MATLKGRTIFITGASRGIGRAIALRCAQDGANIVLAAKTAEPHPKLSGTIHSVAAEVENAGAKALALQVDVRDANGVYEAVKQAAASFGGIDILVNNASAISLSGTLATAMKRYDLLMAVNVRATYLCSQACIPYLKRSDNAHILNLSPPLNLDKQWFKEHVAYTISKYGMSMCTLGMAAELSDDRIAVNSLWPKTTIATAAVEAHFPEAILKASRKAEIVADAAHAILTRPSTDVSGYFFIDEDVLRAAGVTDFEPYAVSPGEPLWRDIFLE